MASDDLNQAERALAEGDIARGERLVKRVLAASPNDVRAHELMAYARSCRGDETGALKHLRAATAHQGSSARAWYELAGMLRARGDRAEARAAYAQAVARDPGYFPAFHDLGTLLAVMGEHEASLRALDQALALQPASYEAHHNRGRTLVALRREEEALESYNRALASQPRSPVTLLNRGEALSQLRRYDEALADYQRALEIDPNYDDARWNEALLRLLLGELEAGWRLYECRWTGSMAWQRRHHGIPRLPSNAALQGKRVLVWWEQGFGDTLHFCRYLPLLAARGARVVFEVQSPLEGLMHSLGHGIEVIATGTDPGACDYQVPLLSLPLEFNTTMDTIPAQVPYLAADPGLAARWKSDLGPAPRIAVACAGHSGQKDDQARSMQLAELAPLADVAELYVVQVDVRQEDRAFAHAFGTRIHFLDDRIRDFNDSAAILANMDAVVTVDTSLAHLAAALAIPTWIMLPWTPTWRWMIDRDDSPWYPTARLVRQATKGRWDDVVRKVRTELLASFAA